MKVQKMKNLSLKMLALVGLALVALASPVLAQTYPQGSVTTVGTGVNRLFVARGNYTSATTTAQGVNITPQSTKPVIVVARGSVAASATITNELADGTVLNSQAIAIGTTPVSVTFPAPAYYEVVRVSVTTALTGTNSVGITVLQ